LQLDWGFVGVVITLGLTALTATGGFFRYRETQLFAQLESPDDRKDIKEALEKEGVFDRYLEWLSWFNDRLDAFFGLTSNAAGRLSRGSYRACFRRCLSIAYVYPLVVYLIAWICGARQEIGGVEVLPAPPLWWQRLGYAALLFLAASGLGLYRRRLDDIGVKITQLIRWIFRIHRATAKPVPLWVTECAGSALAFAGILAGAAAFALAFPGALAFAIVLAGAFGFAGGMAFALAGAYSFAFAFTVAYAGTFAFLLLLFFAALPLANAVLDMLSLLVTRYFLKRAQSHPSGLKSYLWLILDLLADFLAAFLCLMLLAMLLPNVIVPFNVLLTFIDGPQIDWEAYLSAAMHEPTGDGLFVWLMLLTTLAPTLVHLTLGLSAAFMALVPGKIPGLLGTYPPDDHTGPWPRLGKQQSLARHLAYREFLWTLVAFVVVALTLSGFTYAAFHLLDDIGYSFNSAALCATSWEHGYCPWFD